MRPRSYQATSWPGRRFSPVHINDDGLTGPTWWGGRETLTWKEIQDVRLDQWCGSYRGYQFNVVPNIDGKRKIALHIDITNVGELINVIKEQAGFLPPIRDLDTFLSKRPRYRDHPTWLTVSLAGHVVLGLLIGIPCVMWSMVNRPPTFLDAAPMVFLVGWILFVVSVAPAWRLLWRIGLHVSADQEGLTQYRGPRVLRRLAWDELRKVDMLWDRTILAVRNGQRLTVFQNLSHFDELNQIIRLQKERLQL